MISFSFFIKDVLTVKYKKYKNKNKEVHVTSNVMEVNKTVHIFFFKHYKRLKRKIKIPKSIKNKFNC